MQRSPDLTVPSLAVQAVRATIGVLFTCVQGLQLGSRQRLSPQAWGDGAIHPETKLNGLNGVSSRDQMENWPARMEASELGYQ